MLFTGSEVLVGSLVHGFLVLFFFLRFALWGPGGAVQPVRDLSLVWCLLFYFV
jgi:hypothetical protein